jgi:hypothetical protein
MLRFCLTRPGYPLRLVEHEFVRRTDGAGTVALAGLAGSQLTIKFVLGHDPVASGSLGEIKRAIAAIDQIRHRLAHLKLPDTDGNRDAGKYLPGRAASDRTLRDGAAYALGNRRAGGEVGTRKHGDELFPAISRRQIDFSNPLP